MSFNRKRDYCNVYKKVRIDVSAELHCDDCYVVLREPYTDEAMVLRSSANDDDESVKAFKNLLPQVMIDHNFYEDDDQRMSNEDVAAILYESFGAFQKVLGDYCAEVFPNPQQKKEK